jgi:peptidyl-tRNA hydrolase
MGSHKITTGVNSMDISCEGNFSPEDGKAYYNDFQKALAKVNPQQTHLRFDVTKLAVSEQKYSQPILKSVMELYKTSGINKITVDTGSNVILKMQLSRLATEVGLNLTFK